MLKSFTCPFVNGSGASRLGVLRPPLPTAVELSPLEVRVLRGEGCLPFPGSRPVWARVAGQAEVVEILAERARNEFRRVQAEEVLPEAKRLLP